MVASTKKPYVILHAPKGGIVSEFLPEMESADYQMVQAKQLADMGKLVRKKYPPVIAYVIDINNNIENLEKYIAHIDPAFRAEGGPIIVVMSEGVQADKESWSHFGMLKFVPASKGALGLKVALSVEVEEFARIRYLRSELKKKSSSMGQVISGEFRIKTRREAQNLASILSVTCPDPMPVAMGLTELLINGVEHGCLSISHDEKGRLIEEGRLAEEMEYRRTLPEYANRYVTLYYHSAADRVRFIIKDDGEGFDFESYINASEGHAKKHGRGIMMAKGCFMELEYRGCGNEVHAVHIFNTET